MKPTLFNIAFEITSECNLNCKYCYNIWKRPEEKAFFNSYKQSIKTIKRLLKLATVQNITFTGGEPTLSERFAEVVLFSRMQNIQVTVITNGNATKKTDFGQLIKLGVQSFQIPILSKEKEAHDYMTGTKGSWKNSLNSIVHIINNGGVVIPVVIISKINYTQIEETLRFIHEIGLRRIMLNRFNIGGAGIKHSDELALNHKELNQAFHTANILASELKLNLSSNVCTPFCVVNPKEYPNIDFGACPANPYYKPLTLDIFGNLRLCNHSPHNAGNIYKNSFGGIFNSEYAKSWRKIIPDFCNTCELYSDCAGGCKAASEQLGLDLRSVDPLI